MFDSCPMLMHDSESNMHINKIVCFFFLPFFFLLFISFFSFAHSRASLKCFCVFWINRLDGRPPSEEFHTCILSTHSLSLSRPLPLQLSFHLFDLLFIRLTAFDHFESLYFYRYFSSNVNDDDEEEEEKLLSVNLTETSTGWCTVQTKGKLFNEIFVLRSQFSQRIAHTPIGNEMND